MKIKLNRNRLERYKPLLESDQSELIKSLLGDLQSQNLEAKMCAVQFCSYYSMQSKYIDLFLEISGGLSGDSVATKLFWESITVDINGSFEVDSRVKLYMNLSTVSQNVDKSIMKKVSRYVDSVILKKLDSWVGYVAESGYFSENVFDAILAKIGVMKEQLISVDTLARLDEARFKNLFNGLVVVTQDRVVELSNFVLSFLDQGLQHKHVQYLVLDILPSAVKAIKELTDESNTAIEFCSYTIERMLKLKSEVPQDYQLVSKIEETLLVIGGMGLGAQIYDELRSKDFKNGNQYYINSLCYKLLFLMEPKEASLRIKSLLEEEKWYPALDVVSSVANIEVAEDLFEAVIAIWSIYDEQMQGKMGHSYNIGSILQNIAYKMPPSVAVEKLQVLYERFVTQGGAIFGINFDSLVKAIKKDHSLSGKGLELIARIIDHSESVEAFGRILLQAPNKHEILQLYIKDQNPKIRKAAAQVLPEIVQELDKQEALNFLSKLLIPGEQGWTQYLKAGASKVYETLSSARPSSSDPMDNLMRGMSVYFESERKNDNVERQASRAMVGFVQHMTETEVLQHFKALLSHKDYVVKEVAASAFVNKMKQIASTETIERAFSYIKFLLFSKDDPSIQQVALDGFAEVLLKQTPETAVKFIKNKIDAEKCLALLDLLPKIIIKNGFEFVLLQEGELPPETLECKKVYFYLVKTKERDAFTYVKESVFYKIRISPEKEYSGEIELDSSKLHIASLFALLKAGKSGSVPSRDLTLLHKELTKNTTEILKDLHDIGHWEIDLGLMRQVFNIVVSKSEKSKLVSRMMDLAYVAPELSSGIMPYFENILKSGESFVISRYLSLLGSMVKYDPAIVNQAWRDVKSILDRVSPEADLRYTNILKPIKEILTAAPELSEEVYKSLGKIIKARCEVKDKKQQEYSGSYVIPHMDQIQILELFPILLSNLPGSKKELMQEFKIIFRTVNYDSEEKLYAVPNLLLSMCKLVSPTSLVEECHIATVCLYSARKATMNQKALNFYVAILNSMELKDLPEFLVYGITKDYYKVMGQTCCPIYSAIGWLFGHIAQRHENMVMPFFIALKEKVLQMAADNNDYTRIHFSDSHQEVFKALGVLSGMLPTNFIVNEIISFQLNNQQSRESHFGDFAILYSQLLDSLLKGFLLGLGKLREDAATSEIDKLLETHDIRLKESCVEGLKTIASKSYKVARLSCAKLQKLLDESEQTSGFSDFESRKIAILQKQIVNSFASAASELPSQEALRKLKPLLFSKIHDYKSAAILVIPKIIEKSEKSKVEREIWKQIKPLMKEMSDNEMLQVLSALSKVNADILVTEIGSLVSLLNSNIEETRHKGYLVLKEFCEKEASIPMLSSDALATLVRAIEPYIFLVDRYIKEHENLMRNMNAAKINSINYPPAKLFDYSEEQYKFEIAQQMAERVQVYKGLISACNAIMDKIALEIVEQKKYSQADWFEEVSQELQAVKIEKFLSNYLSQKVCEMLLKLGASGKFLESQELDFIAKHIETILIICSQGVNSVIVFGDIYYELDSKSCNLFKEWFQHKFSNHSALRLQDDSNDTSLEIYKIQQELLTSGKSSFDKALFEKSCDIARDVVERLKLANISANDGLWEKFEKDLARNLREGMKTNNLLRKSLNHSDYAEDLAIDIVSYLYHIDSHALPKDFLVEKEFFRNMFKLLFENIEGQTYELEFTLNIIGNVYEHENADYS